MRLTGLLTAMLLASALSAQQLSFTQVTGPNAPAGVRKIFEDNHGGLWLAGNRSDDVLRYFDGKRFITPFTGDFPQVLVNGMAEDSDGGIWLGTTGGVYRLFQGRLQRLFDGFAGWGITTISRNVFLTTMQTVENSSEGMLFRISKVGTGWTMERITKIHLEAHATIDRLGDVLYPCEGGYCEVAISAIEKFHSGSSLGVITHKIASLETFSAIVRDRKGCMWFEHSFHTEFQCPGDLIPTVLPYGVAAPQAQLVEMNDGSMVLAGRGTVAIGRPGSFQIATIANGYPSFGEVLVSRENEIWFGYAGGLWVLTRRKQIEYWTERDGLSGNPWSILPLKNKTFAIAGDQLEVLTDDRSRWRPLLQAQDSFHLMRGPAGTVLIGGATGVIQTNMAGKVLRKSAPAVVSMLAQAQDGQIWSSGNELARVQIGAAGISLEPEVIGGPQLSGRDMKLDDHGELWSCYGAGLMHRTLAGWHPLPVPDPAAGPTCNAFTIDRNGDAWLGTNSMPLILIHHSTGPTPKVENIERLDDIGGTHFLGTDSRGRLWRGTSEGVFVADPEQARRGQWLALNRADGLPGNDTNQKSFTSDSDGSVWFGIDNSVIHIFPPNDMVHPSYSPAVFVSGFSRDGGGFEMAEQVSRVPHGAEVTAYVGSLQMDRRNALHLRYRVLPEQTAWTLQDNFDIQLGKLSSGTHTLELQASLGTGAWSSTAAQSVEVLRTVWLSTPALAAFALSGALVIGGGYRWRRKRRLRARTLLPGIEHWRKAAFYSEFDGSEAVIDGQFEVLRIIARGGFGTVWEARDRKQQGRGCAVKVFRRELIDKVWLAKRFQHEISALQRVRHPNVVSMYGHGNVSSGAPYLAMELIEGETLREKLNRTRLDRVESANYLRQIAAALGEIHLHGICHRDVKPENVMIRNGAKAGAELVLIDFSIAIVQDPDETIHGLSRAAGTLYYMAPEQAIGYADESSDIYSLAKIVIEMLTGERLSTLLPNASIDLPLRVRELLVNLHAGLSPESIDLLASALEFDPSRRPNRAKAFGARIAEDLDVADSCSVRGEAGHVQEIDG